MMERELGLVDGTLSDDIDIDMGISNSLVMPVSLLSGDRIRFMTSSNGKDSGVLNSDSQILKISAYSMEPNANGKIFYLSLRLLP